MNCNDKKKFRTSEASSKASLRTKGAIDKFLNILDTNLFRKYNKQWSQDARERFNISGSLFYEENNKAIPNKEAFQAIDKAKKIIYETEQGNNKKEDVYFNLNSSPEIQFDFKISNIISGNLAKIKQWESNKSVSQELLYNKIQQLGVPKEQLELLKNSDGNTIEEKLTNLIANYSYTIEINTAKNKNLNHFNDLRLELENSLWVMVNDEIIDVWNNDDNVYTLENAPDEIKEYFTNFKNNNINTAHYSDLTVPGGTNGSYIEANIETPMIVPSIQSHAHFKTDNTIGWMRADEKQNYQEKDIDNLIEIMKKSGILEVNCG